MGVITEIKTSYIIFFKYFSFHHFLNDITFIKFSFSALCCEETRTFQSASSLMCFFEPDSKLIYCKFFEK